MELKINSFGKLGSKEILLYTLRNSNGITAKVTNYGGIITSLVVPDKNGIEEDIVLGYNNFDEYLENDYYLGAIIGRFSNRIAKGKFNIEGIPYLLVTNNNGNHLHGGKKGFSQAIWKGNSIKSNDFVGVELSYLSKDMEEGYPGNLEVKVNYKLTNNNELKIEYLATTDKTTIVNLTQHSYFNLSGNLKSDILEHQLKINANYFLPINNNSIPLGYKKSVINTPFDFSEFTKIGNHINDVDEQLNFGSGYDHYFVLNKENRNLELAAVTFDEKSGRLMEVYTTKPGLQLYTGNFLEASIVDGKSIGFEKRSGFCLETQYPPDAPNQPDFLSSILLPENRYKETTIFKFSTKQNEAN